MTGPETADRHRRLRILAVHRYFWPDTPPYASLLRQILARWKDAGHEVSVLSSQPSYKQSTANNRQCAQEEIDGIKISRMRLPNETGRPVVRVLNAARLALGLLWRAVFGRYDVIMISTSPPVVGGVAAALAARLTDARFIYHCMDIHPEVGSVSGEFARPALFRLLRRLDSWACRRADPVVVLSNDMMQTLRDRPGGESLNIHVLNNFELPATDGGSDQPPFDKNPDALTVLFAGNVGRFQGLETAVASMARLKHRRDIEFVVMGDGAARRSLQEQSEETGARVRFVGHKPVHVAKAAMRNADLGFVSLIPEIYRYAFPSKTMTYLAQGCPLLIAVERESELARDALELGYGYWVPTNDDAALAQMLESIADDRAALADMSARALDKARRDYGEFAVLDQWAALLEKEPNADLQAGSD